MFHRIVLTAFLFAAGGFAQNASDLTAGNGLVSARLYPQKGVISTPFLRAESPADPPIAQDGECVRMTIRGGVTQEVHWSMKLAK